MPTAGQRRVPSERHGFAVYSRIALLATLSGGGVLILLHPREPRVAIITLYIFFWLFALRLWRDAIGMFMVQPPEARTWSLLFNLAMLILIISFGILILVHGFNLERWLASCSCTMIY